MPGSGWLSVKGGYFGPTVKKVVKIYNYDTDFQDEILALKERGVKGKLLN